MDLKSRAPSTHLSLFSGIHNNTKSNMNGNISILPLTIHHPAQQIHSSSEEHYSLSLKISAAIFYAVSSTIIIFINKLILTTYQFHYFYFLGAIQFLFTSVILFLLCIGKYVEIPTLSIYILKDIFPIFILFFGNVLTGLGGTQSLNLPMFTVLRRFTILFSMIGEYFLLSITPTSHVMISVFLMIFGAIIAALYDFSYDPIGYFYVLLNDIFTALNGIYIKKATISKKCSKMGILFYNSLLSFVALALYYLWSEILFHNPTTLYSTTKTSPSSSSSNMLQEISQFSGWNDSSFIFLFILTAIMGSILNYSIFLCTTVNSPLTTAVIGCLKNILVTYFSMIFLSSSSFYTATTAEEGTTGETGGTGTGTGDYQFNYCNFIGLNISILGSIYYTLMTLKAS